MSGPKDNPHQNLWRTKPLLIGLIVIVAVMLLISGYMFTASQIGKNEWIDTYRKVNPYLPGFTCCVDQLIASPVDNCLEKRIGFTFMVPDNVNPSPIVIESQRVMVLPYWVGNQQLWASDHIAVLSKFRVLPQIDGK